MITRHIADLLYHHECVIVPALGGFIKSLSPAQINHSTHEFRPPQGTVAFNAGLSGNDGQLANYIASIENTSYRNALHKINFWVDECHDSLKKGDKVILEGIGDLFLNNSGKLEFSPSMKVNFNADSFGLPAFFAKPAIKDTLNLPEIQFAFNTERSAKYHRLIPETLKWAAVLAPFIAFALWGSLNGNIIDNYVHNYTGMFSWVRSTPGKTAPVPAASSHLNRVEEAPVVVIRSPAILLFNENISFDPGIVSYTELARNQISIKGYDNSSDTSVITESIAPKKDFFIIGGAFRDQNNAIRLIGILKDQGYPASVVDTTPSGLYIVSMKGFTEYNEAIKQLDKIKKAGYSSSWILKKQRS